MNFSLTEEQVMIRESARTFLADACDSESVRAVMASETGFDEALWNLIAQELGWCALPVAETDGGLGLGAVELMLVQEQAGYRLLCAPFFSSVCLASALLRHAASNEARGQYLSALAAGDLRLSAPLPSTHLAWQVTELSADEQAGEWRISGELARVPDAQSMQMLVVTARAADGLGLFIVAADQQALRCENLDSWDTGRRFARVDLDAATALRVDGGSLVAGLARAADEARLMIAAEQLGAAQRCLDLTLDYVQERKQFGRIIGSFQAVKHRCAEMMVQVENTRSQVYGAAAAMASDSAADELAMEVAAARALATETLQYCAGEAIQLHGGVGFTWEYDPQLFFKRGQASAHWLGDAAEMRAVISGRLFA